MDVLAFLNRKRGDLVKAILRQLKAATAVPYCQAYSIPATFIPPADFQAKAYAGLMAWHIVEAAAQWMLLSYWQDEQHYLFNKTRFERTMKVTAANGWGGATGDVHGNEPAWWRPASLREVLIGASAVFGAVVFLGDISVKVGDTLLTRPQAEVLFSDAKVDLSEGGTGRITMSARNATESVATSLHISAKLLGGNGTAQAVPLMPSSYQDVAPDASQPVTATITAPRLGTRHSPPADYKLSVSIAGRTWRLGRTAMAPPGELPVRVWPQSFGWTRQLKPIAQGNPRVYYASGVVYSAGTYPAGLMGAMSIVVPAAADMDLNILTPYRPVQQLPSAPANQRKTLRMDFMTPALDKYHEYPFQMTITSRRSDAVDWGAIQRSLTLTLSE